LDEEQRERCEEEDVVGTRGRAEEAQWRGLTSGDGQRRHGSGLAHMSGARAEGPDLRRSKPKQIKISGPGRLRETLDANLMEKIGCDGLRCDTA
jgi:hypothetical protein